MSKKTCKNVASCKGVVCTRRTNMIKTSNYVLTTREQTDLLFGAIRSKSAKRGLVCQVEWKDIHRLVKQRNTCPLTGIPFDERRGAHLPYRRSVDRICNSIGYTKDNIWIINNASNKMKGIYKMGVLMHIVTHMYEYQQSINDAAEQKNQLNFNNSLASPS